MEEGLDRISELPESILLHILSFLNMKDTVKTSVLSKQWEYIWTSVPSLTFEYDIYEYKLEKIGPFVMWVNKTLLQCENKAIRKFYVKFRYQPEFAGDVDLWAQFVARNKIQDVSFEFSGLGCSYKLPQSLCQNSYLSRLSISRCTVDLGLDICWTFLKSLSIAWMSLDDDIMNKILSGSPMLQVLKIYCFSGNVHIKSNSLCVLAISSHIESLIDISTPNIQSLCIIGRVNVGKLVLCSSTLFKAVLNFRFLAADKEKNVYGKFTTFIENILHVVQLEVGFYFLETFALLGKKSLSSLFSNLTCLKLSGLMDKTDIVGIICLLKCSPNLEKLVVDKEDSDGYFYKNGNKFLRKLADKYWKSERRTEKFGLPYLKLVKFNGFREVNEFVHVLLQLLLENAMLLDNIVIDMGETQMIVTPTSRVV